MPSDANAMTTKGNVVLYLDEELVEKSEGRRVLIEFF